MRVRAIGAFMMKGKAKKTGDDYGFARLVIQSPQETVSRENMTRTGLGFGSTELDLLPASFKEFQISYPPEGVLMDLKIDNIVEYGKLKPVISGFELVTEK